MCHIRKTHFQLLEVMIAIFLLLICAMPILNAYINMNRAQFEVTRVNQRDHLAHLIHGRIMESLYKQAISWQDILYGKKEKLEKLGNLEETLNQLKGLSYEGFYQLEVEKPGKKDLDSSKKILLKLTITLHDLLSKESIPMIYEYLIYVEHVLSGQAATSNIDNSDSSRSGQIDLDAASSNVSVDKKGNEKAKKNKSYK